MLKGNCFVELTYSGNLDCAGVALKLSWKTYMERKNLQHAFLRKLQWKALRWRSWRE